MRKRYLWLVAAVGLAALLVVYLREHDDPAVEVKKSASVPEAGNKQTSASTAAPSPVSSAEQRRKAVELVTAIYSAPIQFYGRVQDQKGNPIAGAQVSYSIIDKFWEEGSKRTGVSDANGYFSLTGEKGAALTVGVSKEGYDPIYQRSNGSFSFGTAYDPQRDRIAPTKKEPAAFVLRKKADAEQLLIVRSRQYELPKNGVAVDVNLETGKAGNMQTGGLRIECWVDDQTKDKRGRFDWKCRISVPDGGLIQRDPEYDFEAPEEGYEKEAEIVMTSSATNQQRWTSQIGREYFIELPNERYARAKLTVFVGKRTFFVLESYLNPSGSRNLEYNPALESAAQ